MGGMMGNGYGTTAPSYLWLIPVALAVVSAVAVVGAVFYFAFPELKYIRGSCNPQETVKNTSGATADSSTISPVSTVAAVSSVPALSRQSADSWYQR